MARANRKRNLEKVNQTRREYVEATYNLLCEVEYNCITVRELAKATNRNSATLYYYFEDLEELLAISSIKYLMDYYETVASIESKKYNNLEVELYSWACFAWYAYQNVPIYENFFLRDISRSEKALNTYLEIFPEDKDVISSYFLGETFMSLDLRMRDKWLLEKAADEGIISHDSVEYLGEFDFYLFFGIMNEIHYSYRDEQVVHDAVDRFICILTETYKKHLLPGQSILDCHLERIFHV